MAYRQQYDSHSQSRLPPQQQQQQQQQYYNPGPPQNRQQAGYDSRYDQQQQQQQYGYGYDQGGYEQWDNHYYDGYDYGNDYSNAQPQAAPNQVNAQARQPQQPRGRGPPPPPPQQQQQAQYAQEQAYDDRYQQPQQQPPNTRRPTGRANGPPPSAQQGRGVSRPPGLDRSLLAPTSPKRLPQDNPFPTFPATKGNVKPARPVPTDSMDQAMALMSVNDNEVQGERAQQRGPPVRGQPTPAQNRPPPSARPQGNMRQDSGQFESHGYPQQRPPPNRMPPGQRPPPNMNAGRGQPQLRQDPGMQRAVTMPQNIDTSAYEGAYGGQQQWNQSGTMDEYHGLSSPTRIPPRPSTAGGTRPGPPRQPDQRPPMPQAPPQQQYQPEQQYQDTYQRDPHASLDNFYDDYYDEGDDRKSIASTIDMPNFDAIPETNTRHRRGDSIDNHLVPTSFANAAVPNNNFQQQPSRSRSHADLRGQFGNGFHEMPGDAPPLPALPRANTGFGGPGGYSNGPRARGPPNRGMTTDGYGPVQPPDFDPRYGQQPPPFAQRGYSDDSAHSEPPPNMMRNGPPMAGTPIPRPGTTAPMPGRMPSDPMGRRPATTQPPRNPDTLPAHPVPVRSGLVSQGQPQQLTQNARPPPVRQYNSDGRASLESQHSMAQRSVAQRPSSAPHPVTHDELNRLRRVWKDNPTDQATGLKLAKKLIEASQVLADENGTADTKTRNKNKEKFVNEGYKIVKKLAQVQYGDAMFYLADCYGQGLLGLQVDTKEAFTLYQGAAKAGHAASAYRTAVCCEMGHEEGGGTKRDPLKAVQWYRRAAALGDTPAMYKMGMILLKGLLGQPKNQGEAINMLQRAASNADKDNPHALHELALIYEAPQTSNERVIPDEAYALELFLQAANLGYKFSQFRLGQAYEYGLLGCPIDPRTSIGWYTKSAAQEEHQSELALSGWYLTGIEGVLQQSDTEAYLWARKAACAEPPLPKALFAMGYFTEVGIGCPRSLDEAKRWYGRAAAYKFPKAQERLEELKRGGSKAQMKRERLSRTDQKQQEENCTIM